MATSKDFAVLDLQNDPQGLGVDLQFQDFGDARVQPVGSGAGGGSQHEQTIHFTEFPDSAEDDPEQEKVSPKKKKRKMDVDSSPVLSFLPPEVNVRAVLQESMHGLVDLVQVAALQVREKKLTSRAVKELAIKLPVSSLSHLKRVKRIVSGTEAGEDISESKLGRGDAIVVYLDYLENFGIPCKEHWEGDNINILTADDSAKVFTRLKERDIDTSLFEEQVFASKVAKYAPRIRKIYDQAALYWPCTFHEDIYLTQLSSSNFFSEEEMKLIVHYMNKAIQLGHIASKNGAPAIGTVIVNDLKGAIVGQGIDARHRHPLQHAVMLAIDDVSHQQGGGAWSKQKLPSKTDDELLSVDSENGDLEASRPASCADENRVQKSKEKNHCNNASDVNTQNNATNNPIFASQTMNCNSACESISYICTGFDVYISHEPCMMCAMALLHSRVRRIFYTCPQLQFGALGSLTKLHTLPGINHRYEVFTVTKR
ncbi:probable inactive tRNA-specific adenosine deaminase-like protein 3 isoform X1 [Penaeus monodon]|uniref:probable inactive tRNA-specific adenosine deaminase-like protein 3 isoform X1 n=1 Tax=Penaeus monodon TaxID=6687 RepID=UPI0018A75D89|nr:probable inactive tRNA-specific adenosine deaminase-like protein 3 isoform X1 [Penaeus monodon]